MRIDIDLRPLTSLLIALFLVSTLSITTGLAQDSPQWHLPEGASARLGKGTIRDIAYSPDGSRLAVAGGYRYLALRYGHLSRSRAPHGTHWRGPKCVF